MGMSASQARYLGLVARQNNLEYQGQQINQERSILSQQVTTLYNTLLAMQVPTPPSTSDYTTIEYTGTDGASTFTIGTVQPNGSQYKVELLTTSTGASLAQRYGTAQVEETHGKIKGDEVPYSAAELTLGDISTYYVLEEGSVRKAIPTHDFIKDGNKYYLKNDGTRYVKESPTGQSEYTDLNATQYSIAGKNAYTWDNAEELYGDMLDFDGYKQAIENKYGTVEEQGGIDKAITKDSFYIYFTFTEAGRPQPHFALKNDVEGMDDRTVVYDYTENGSFTKATVYNHCELTFDVKGRITAIDIPYYDKSDPETPIGYNTVALQAKTKTDEAAYQDASIRPSTP